MDSFLFVLNELSKLEKEARDNKKKTDSEYSLCFYEGQECAYNEAYKIVFALTEDG